MLAVGAAIAASTAASAAAAASASAAAAASASAATAASATAATTASATAASTTAASTTASTTAATTTSTTTATTSSTTAAGTPTASTPTPESLENSGKGLQNLDQGGTAKPPTHEVQLEDGSKVEARTANDISDKRAVELRNTPGFEKVQTSTVKGVDANGLPTETQEHLYRYTDANGTQTYTTSNTDIYAKTATEQQNDMLKVMIVGQVLQSFNQ